MFSIYYFSHLLHLFFPILLISFSYFLNFLETKTPVVRKIPNFAEIHKKTFEKMESLVDARKRVADRHVAMINPVLSATKCNFIIYDLLFGTIDKYQLCNVKPQFSVFIKYH